MPMPLTSGHPNPDRLCRKKSFHQRNGSGELDVFEAANYFSGYNESYGDAPQYKNNYTQKIMKDEKPSWRGGRRISLDMGSIGNPIHHHNHNHNHNQEQQSVDKQILKEIKKHKQPSSPGGRLASFLNSLFNQTSSKKKKTKSSTQSIRDEDENSPGGGRRRRRSSISHFRSSSTNNNATYSSSSSGFRTPPPYNANTPTKGSYKSNNNLSDLKQIGSLSKHYMIKPTTGSEDQSMDEKRKTGELLDEIFSFKIDGYKGKGDKLLSSTNIINGGDKKLMEKNDLILFDDGAESDSSSDLFELQNCDLGIYSSGLPVYETTSMDNIKRSAPISTGAS